MQSFKALHKAYFPADSLLLCNRYISPTDYYNQCNDISAMKAGALVLKPNPVNDEAVLVLLNLAWQYITHT